MSITVSPAAEVLIQLPGEGDGVRQVPDVLPRAGLLVGLAHQLPAEVDPVQSVVLEGFDDPAVQLQFVLAEHIHIAEHGNSALPAGLGPPGGKALQGRGHRGGVGVIGLIDEMDLPA